MVPQLKTLCAIFKKQFDSTKVSMYTRSGLKALGVFGQWSIWTVATASLKMNSSHKLVSRRVPQQEVSIRGVRARAEFYRSPIQVL
ncbi:hypothetical protein PVAG01_05016 [Phlyctema vagabunda]|uniref:Uncharacterized protein n=1 Tax=Phlyctema vagabunda TaxID=108571 RepID=A0ABR4PJ00_9HELO